MGSCNRTSSLLLAAALTVTAAVGNAQTAIPVDGIQKQLSQLYQTAKATADGTDLVTAGAVLVLQKDHLLMDQVDQPIPTPNVYTRGGISNGGMAGAANFFKAFSKLGGVIPGAGATAGAAAAAQATREFVAGEKFFVTRIDTRTDGVTFVLMSDPIKDVRYHATLKFPFARGTSPSPDDVAAQVSEVLKLDDASQDQTAGNQGGDKGGDKAAAAAPAETKTIAIGQTRDQVVAMFGVPSKIVQLGTKEIDIFPDMKVTFVQNKVVDVK